MLLDAETIKSLAELGTEVREMNRRLASLENLPDTIHELSTSIKLLTQEQSNTKEDIANVKSDVASIKSIPAKRWESVIGYIIAGFVGAFITRIASIYFGQ